MNRNLTISSPKLHDFPREEKPQKVCPELKKYPLTGNKLHFYDRMSFTPVLNDIFRVQ